MVKKTIGCAARHGWPLYGLAALAAALCPVSATLAQESVETVEVAVQASVAVTDASGTPLAGGGAGDNSACVFQLICAGANGVPDTPPSAGAAGGDDTIVGESRFGEGASPNSGKFSVLFEVAADMTNQFFFARAWNGASFETSTLYGDSAAKPVAKGWDGAEIVFGESWSLSGAVAGADQLLDDNDDGIPDAWAAVFRPDLVQSASTPAAQTSPSVSNPNDFFVTSAPPNSHANADGNPSRVFATDKFVFVLETYSHRIAVYDRTSGTNLFYFGATDADNKETTAAGARYTDTSIYAPGTGNGAFRRPEGMALDTFSGQPRFAVADTGNNRVQIFSFNRNTGAISFLATFGTESTPVKGPSAANGTFSQPLAVAFANADSNGNYYLLVADTGNSRVARLSWNVSRGTMTWKNVFRFTEDDILEGICWNEDGSGDGFWVANSGTGRQRVSFHRRSGFTAEPVASFGTPEDPEFAGPADVQTWTVGGRVRLAVADRGGSRVRILDPRTGPTGAYTGVVAVADIGSASDGLLQSGQKLFHPRGVFPVTDENLIYVADTGHNQIKWYGLRADGDGDGMDDLWEDANGLDSSIDDSRDDLDGDGLTNLGEYLSGCDPKWGDSDDDGKGDMFEMVQISDPLDPESKPAADPVTILSVSADPQEAAVGTTVTITATFASAVSGPGKYVILGEDGAVIASGVPVFNGTTATVDIDTAGLLGGTIRAELTFAECDSPSVSTSFTLIDERSVEVYWSIDSFECEFDGATPSIVFGWTAPTDNLPTDPSVKMAFRLYFSDDPSANPDEWVELTDDPVEIDQSEAGNPCQYRAILAEEPISDSSSGFFFLKWLNKIERLE